MHYALIFLFLFCKISNAAPINVFSIDPDLNPNRPRDFILPPIESFFLPGFDQFMEHQYDYAFGYTGLNVLGYTIQKATPHYSVAGEFSDKFDLCRIKHLGISFRYLASNLSTYHSFRTAVESRKKNGEFRFLTYSESPQELAFAPFNIKYATNPTTLLGIPILGVLLSSVEYVKHKFINKTNAPFMDYKLRAPTFNDLSFTGFYSFSAGVGEEAFFRGYLMPLAMHYTGNEWVSNGISSVLFGLAHLSWEPLPISQTLFGFYMGYLSQRNGWTLGESIFIHTWWDVYAILFQTLLINPNSEFKFSFTPLTIYF